MTALILRLLSLVFLWPLFGWLMQRLIQTSGQDALTDQEIATFVMSPIGLVGALGIVTIGVGILALEQSSLMLQAFGAFEGYRVSPVRAVVWGMNRFGSTLLLCLQIVIQSLAMLLPFVAAIAALAWWLLGDADINYYLTDRPIKFWLALGCGCLLALAAIWVIAPRIAPWILALPLQLITGQSTQKAIQESGQIVGSRRWSLALLWVAWLILQILLTSLFTSLLYGIVHWILSAISPTLTWLVPVLGAFFLLWLVVGLILSLFQSVSFALLVAGLYRAWGWSGVHGSQIRQEYGELWMDHFFRQQLRAESIPTSAAVRGVVLEKQTDPIDLLSLRWLWFLGAVGLLAVAGGLWLLAASRSTEDGIVLAHRGAASVRPENTLASFDKACEDLADYVELDVQETADGQVVVMHDSDYMKIAGNPLKVWDAKLEQLIQIDIGTRFSPAYSDQRTPLLKEALQLCKGRAKVDIELKYYGHNQRLVERVIEIVEAEGMQDQVVLMSLYLPFVEELKRFRPKWTVGLLAAVAIGDLSKAPADFLALNTRSVGSGLIDRAQQRGKKVYVWTIDHPVLMAYYLGMGVDGIITNRPGTARQVIEQLRQLSPAQRFLLSVSVRLGLVPAESTTDLSEAGA
ncbi:MAG: glycerophosphodiester phosphodiesterase family protein [Pirellulaceae bacterium]